MLVSKVAKRYARAWFDLAKEQGVQDDVFNDFQTIRDKARESRELARMFYSPIVKTAKKINVLRAVFTDEITPLTLQYIEMLTEKGRENFIVQIAEVYTSLYLADKNVVVANITTATALDEDMRNKFKDIVRKKTGKKEVQLKEQVNADLIGGFILRVGDIQEDTSIQQKLKKISRDFKENRTMLTA